MSITRRLVAECSGAAFLLAMIVGSGIMPERSEFIIEDAEKVIHEEGKHVHLVD